MFGASRTVENVPEVHFQLLDVHLVLAVRDGLELPLFDLGMREINVFIMHHSPKHLAFV